MVADSFYAESWTVGNLVARAGFQMASFDIGRPAYGGPQRDHGISLARPGNWLVFQDDTDTFLPGALAELREALRGESGPCIVGIQRPGWQMTHESKIGLGEIDGHQLVTPNLPGKVGKWGGDRYECDWTFVSSTMELWPEWQPTRIPLILSYCP